MRWITAFIDIEPSRFEMTARFWESVAGAKRSEPRGGEGQFETLVPPDGDAYLRIQRTSNGPRVHLDLHVDDVDAARAAAEQLGATTVSFDGFAIMASPGGLTFCLVSHHAESSIPTPFSSPRPNRINQVSIDVPDSLYATELEFWSELTGWRQIASDHFDEFTFLDGGPHLPVRLLVQRLGGDHRGDQTVAHLDLGAGEGKDEVARAHVATGASIESTLEYWTVMSAPDGMRYCITHRDP